jgi:hypothetical protein
LGVCVNAYSNRCYYKEMIDSNLKYFLLMAIICTQNTICLVSRKIKNLSLIRLNI